MKIPSLFRLVLLMVVPVAIALGVDGNRARVPPDELLAVYTREYGAGVVRPGRFDQRESPGEAAREELHIESVLAGEARGMGIHERPDVRATVEFQQYQRVSRHWVREVLLGGPPSEEELREIYDSLGGRLDVPEKVTFSHLFQLLPPDDTAAEEEARSRAIRIIEEFKAGRTLEELATGLPGLSDEEAPKVRIGPVETDKIGEEVLAALRRLQPGDISEPVRTRFGLEVLLLHEWTPARRQTPEEVRPMLTQLWERNRMEREWPAFIGQIRGNHPFVPVQEPPAAGEAVDPALELVTVEETVYKAGRILEFIAATHEHDLVADPAERLRAGLPGFIESRQVLLAMKQDGFWDRPDSLMLRGIIEDRTLAEYWIAEFARQLPVSPEECAAYYEANQENFRQSGRITGHWLEWKIDGWDQMGPGERGFQRELRRRELERLLDEYQEGSMTKEEVIARAPHRETFSDTESGPLGYSADMALFATAAGSFSRPFPTKEGMAIGWIDSMKPGELRDFDTVAPAIERTLREDKRRAALAARIAEIEREYREIPLRSEPQGHAGCAH